MLKNQKHKIFPVTIRSVDGTMDVVCGICGKYLVWRDKSPIPLLTWRSDGEWVHHDYSIHDR